MQSVKLVRYFKGYITVRVPLMDADSALNDCRHDAISVWNPKRAEDYVYFCVSRKDETRLAKAFHKSNCVYEIIKRTGFPYILHRYRKRVAFVVAGILGALFLAYMSSFVWSIEVSGNETVSEERIIEVLSELHYGVGTCKYGMEYYQLYQKALLKLPELSWMAINVKGTRAEVLVLEKDLPPVIDDKSVPYNIVSSADGIITDMQVYAGKPLVKVGDYVEKGQLLVLGENGSANAEIKAETEYLLKYVCPKQFEQDYETGQKVCEYRLKIFHFDINLTPNSSISFVKYDKMTVNKQLCVGDGYYLPISLETTVFSELETEIGIYSEEEQKKVCLSALWQAKEDLLPDGNPIEEEITYQQNQTDMVSYLRATYYEDIAVKMP